MKFTSLALVATFLASTAYAAEKPSQVFLKKAIEGNFAEVEMGKWHSRTARMTTSRNSARR